jgi:hypothetical protein
MPVHSDARFQLLIQYRDGRCSLLSEWGVQVSSPWPSLFVVVCFILDTTNSTPFSVRTSPIARGARTDGAAASGWLCAAPPRGCRHAEPELHRRYRCRGRPGHFRAQPPPSSNLCWPPSRLLPCARLCMPRARGARIELTSRPPPQGNSDPIFGSYDDHEHGGVLGGGDYGPGNGEPLGTLWSP